MNIFFTGCTHFDHTNIIRLANRPFEDVYVMNQIMIERWNRTVGPKDIIYHLGDFGYVNRDRAEDLLGRLNGRKVLVHGNHDEHRVISSEKWWHETNYHELSWQGRKIVMFHYPIEDWNGRYKDSVHVHAHTHHRDKMGAIGIKNRVNVTVEAWDYTPVSIEQVMALWS